MDSPGMSHSKGPAFSAPGFIWREKVQPAILRAMNFMCRSHLASLVAMTAVIAMPLAAQQRDLAATADTVFAQWNSTHTPGCAVGASRDGKPLFTRGYGMANLETGTPITPE